jgi:MFS family permease
MSASGPNSDFYSRHLPSTFRALRHRNYRLFFFGQIVSLVGTFFQITALSWLSFKLTGSNRWPAYFSAVQLLPGFFLGPFGGVIADRWPKRRLIMFTQSAFGLLALTMAVLVLTEQANVWNLLGVATLNGLVGALDLPARLSFVTEMVSRDDIVNAVALNSLLFNVARAVGPACAGLVMEIFSPGLCFLVNGLSYLAVLAALFAMRLPPTAIQTHRDRPSFWAGFAALAARPRLALLVGMAGVIAFCVWPFLILLPQLAHDRLNLEGSGYGLLVTATGVGALFAAGVVATFGSLARRRFFVAGGVALAVVGLMGLSQVSDMGWALFWCGLTGAGLITFFATGQAVVQLSADDRVRGRVLGIWSMMVMGGQPLGSLLAGSAADSWGQPPVLVVQSLLCGGLALTFWLCWLCFRPHSPTPSVAVSTKEELS